MKKAMKYVTEIPSDRLKTTIDHELKKIGLKTPKLKENTKKPDSGGRFFGAAISHQQTTTINEEKRITVPTILTKLLSELENNFATEGLFRKAGSMGRQRDIRKNIENGRMNLDSTSPHDLASIVKQYLRELPEPLIHSKVQQSLLVKRDRKCLMMMCLLLPVPNINVLRHLMLFFNRMATFSDVTKMDVYNIAVVVTPNLMTSDEKSGNQRRVLNSQVGIVEMLIRNADSIGFVDFDILDIPGPSIGCSLVDFFRLRSRRRKKYEVTECRSEVVVPECADKAFEDELFGVLEELDRFLDKSESEEESGEEVSPPKVRSLKQELRSRTPNLEKYFCQDSKYQVVRETVIVTGNGNVTERIYHLEKIKKTS